MERIPFKEIRKIVKNFLKDKKINKEKERNLSFRDLRSELKERIKKAPHNKDSFNLDF
jgi:hydroxylamine reductase (hybrid-cluster protein)